MTPEEFVKEFYLLKKDLIEEYFSVHPKSDTGELIRSLKLSEEKTIVLKKILNSALRDALYRVLSGLDGEATIGIRQEAYKIYDEENNELAGDKISGEIEVYAWEYFHNKE